ncbi:MAG: hypothetical protein HOL01_12125 [Planctomycetaceae bacterium]|jgi:hypothetical protein|nr:hypothetical protein [Planctomycetaceae bacterium]MBT6488083.1 hypothetical protein [Planctomycetaceae bacterium]MBT6495288.1 hypothetical protein [Planctomycetaceae bacterium]
MRFHSRRPSTSHFAKRAQTRILRLIGLLVLVMIAVKMAGRASFWGWMFPDPNNGVISQPVMPPETVDKNKYKVKLDAGPKLAQGEFIAAADPVAPDVEKAAEEASADSLEFDPELLATVEDNTMSIRPVEADAYYAVLAKARDLPAETLEKHADADISFAVLMNQSPQFRGKPITIRGEIRRLLPFTAGKNKHEIKDLWEAWLFTEDSGLDPYRIVCTEIPPGIPRAEGLKKAVPVRVTGFFFKIEGYEGRGGLHTAPLLLARTLRWLPPPPVRQNDNGLGPWIVGLVCLTAVGLAFTFWRISASDRSSQTRNFHRYNEPRPEALDALKLLETNDEADMFRSLKEDDGQSPPTKPADAGA